MATGTHSNWLNQWRLAFASIVLISHGYALTGHIQDEPLMLLNGYGLGGVAVRGFFVISGYLIARSWEANPDFAAYLRNRTLRIAPAFAVAFILSVGLVGAIGASDAGAYFAGLDWPLLALQLITLDQPTAPFPGPEPLVNGSLWTIQAEFGCYLLAPLMVRRRWLLLALWLAAASGTMALRSPQLAWLTCFLSGAIYWRFQMTAQRPLIWISALTILGTLHDVRLWEFVLATAGAYLVLSLGLKSKPATASPDISYGVYLYGWPVQKLLVLWGVGIPGVLIPLSILCAMGCGVLSWYGVEKRLLALKKRGTQGPSMRHARRGSQEALADAQQLGAGGAA